MMIETYQSLKLKSGQLRTAGNGASYWKLAVVVVSHTGFQAAPEVGLGRVSADEQDANLARINHDACQINERNTHDLILL
ncbi:uncharacterized protein SN13T_2144 [Lactiplantibacillus plantarum]|jgi:hypothetical protein|nr:uncharacterized protein SN13T_2144 [Lactiplantibacillus plantarum]